MAASFSLTDNTQTPQSSNGTNITFSSVTFNTGASDIAIVSWVIDDGLASGAIPAITIGGQSATVVSPGHTADHFIMGIAYVAAGALTTAAVVITATAGVCNLQGGKGTGISASSAYATNTGAESGTNPFPCNVNVPSNGVGIACVGVYYQTTTVEFTGSTNDPNGDGQQTNATGDTWTIATAHTLTTGSPTTIDATNSTSGLYGQWSMISFTGAASGIPIWPLRM